MDRKTRDERRRAKALAGPRGQLASIGPRIQGRRNGVERIATKRCSYVVGGKKSLIYKRRKADQSLYAIPLITGGHRCVNDVLAKGRCLEHLGVEQ